MQMGEIQMAKAEAPAECGSHARGREVLTCVHAAMDTPSLFPSIVHAPTAESGACE